MALKPGPHHYGVQFKMADPELSIRLGRAGPPLQVWKSVFERWKSIWNAACPGRVSDFVEYEVHGQARPSDYYYTCNSFCRHFLHL